MRREPRESKAPIWQQRWLHRSVFTAAMTTGICAPLTGDRSALEARIDRLLQPLQTTPRDSMATYVHLALLVTLALLAALGLGHVYGKWLVGALLALS